MDAEMNSLLLTTMTDGFSNTFWSACYALTIVYGGLQALKDSFSFGIVYVVALICILSLMANYLKVPKAPTAHVDAVLGSDPLLQRRPAKEENANTELFSHGVGLLRNQNNREEAKALPNEDHGAITVVAHRGAGLDAPENSLAAFRQCKARGCDFIELDVALTKDNVAVIFHDHDVLRMTGIDKKVVDMTFAELSKLDISVNHPLREKFKGEKVPTLDETIRLLVQLKMKVFLDLKDTDEAMVSAICGQFKKYPDLYKNAVVSSFSARVVYNIRRRDPKIVGCMAWRPQNDQFQGWSVDAAVMERRYNFFVRDYLAAVYDVYHDWVLNNVYWWFLGLSAVLLHKDCVSRYNVTLWAKKGIQVFLWTVNTPVEKLYWAKVANVRYLTDTLDGDVLRPILKNDK